jgi:UDP-N-acetylglucosamine diphosphorylase/glucosamine-1-phosphate N-acetyltransferase
MNYILFDDIAWTDLLPLTLTRPVCELRIGILRIREKWERVLNAPCSWLTQAYLSDKYPIKYADQNILINGSLCPDNSILKAIRELQPGEALVKEKMLLAAILKQDQLALFPGETGFLKSLTYQHEVMTVRYPWHIFRLNGEALEYDFELLTTGRESAPVPASVNRLGQYPVFLEEGVRMEFITLNSTGGPMYFGRNSEVMEGSLIRGPFSLGEGSLVKMGAKIYGPTTIGPFCKAGGEINNVILSAYSNKGHEGYLGNSVIGEWCNLGADTNSSNKKNNYSEVRLWSYRQHKFIPTGLQFCGLVMADHSKSGINTMFNTGTVVGMSANVFGDGFPRNFIPSFAWGGAQGFTRFTIPKAIEVAEKAMERRNLVMNETEKNIFRTVFESTIHERLS